MTDTAAIRAAIAATPTAALEDIARAAGATPAEVLACLPEGEVTALPGDLFAEVMEEMAGWGEITFIVNTPDVILEAKGPVPQGKLENGMFNLHGRPIAGHLKAANCATVAFVARKLFGMETRSVQFYSREGNCMFKVYLGRDAERRLIPAQVAAFDAARARFAGVAA